MRVPRTLLVTNDFPPQVGGIQRTLEALWRELPPDSVGVFCPAAEGAETYDAASGIRTFRQPEGFLWPKPGLAARVERCASLMGAEVVLFGAISPLALAGPQIASRGLPYLAAAHGFEYWASTAPIAHSLVRRATSRASRVPVMCSEFIARRVRTAVPDQVPISVLYPGADVDRFHPGLETGDIREKLGIGDRPLVVCVSRLVKRKGQDALIRSMRRIHRKVPDAMLLIVGSGPDEARLRRLAEEAPPGSVVFAGQISEAELPLYYAVGDVFAMPCRTRLAGLEVEGWGNVFVEASACARPIVVGDSGGARETLVDGETGLLVDGRDLGDVADAVVTLLDDPALARKMGEAGRSRVLQRHTWPQIASRLGEWLAEAVR